jgi:hypothetical protein
MGAGCRLGRPDDRLQSKRDDRPVNRIDQHLTPAAESAVRPQDRCEPVIEALSTTIDAHVGGFLAFHGAGPAARAGSTISSSKRPMAS